MHLFKIWLENSSSKGLGVSKYFYINFETLKIKVLLEKALELKMPSKLISFKKLMASSFFSNNLLGIFEGHYSNKLKIILLA